MALRFRAPHIPSFLSAFIFSTSASNPNHIRDAPPGERHARFDLRNTRIIPDQIDMENTSGSPTPAPSPTVAEKTELQSNVKPRHLRFIAFASAIGTGLMIGSGSSLARGGPAGLLLGYLIVGLIVQVVMSAIAEMTAWLPQSRGFAGYATRFVDPAVGFATGWNHALTYVLLLPINLGVTAMLLQYWAPGISPTTWIVSISAIVFMTNMFGVGVFAEIEFVLSTLKILVVLAFFVLCLVVGTGKGPHKLPSNFRPWISLGAFSEFSGQGSAGKAMGIWSTVVQATFAYIGTEMVSVAFSETPASHRLVPSIIRDSTIRVLGLYLSFVVCVGLVVPHTHHKLHNADPTSATSSPVLMVAAGNRHVVSAFNALLLVFTVSAANANVYLASRALWGLAQNNQAPRILRRTNRHGVPVPAVLASLVFSLLSFLTLAPKPAQHFQHIIALVTTLGALNWLSILWSYRCMIKAMDAQDIDQVVLPYRNRALLPWGANIAMGMILLILSGSCLAYIHPAVQSSLVIVTYIGPVLFAGNVVLWRMMWRENRVRPEKADLETNRTT